MRSHDPFVRLLGEEVDWTGRYCYITPYQTRETDLRGGCAKRVQSPVEGEDERQYDAQMRENGVREIKRL